MGTRPWHRGRRVAPLNVPPPRLHLVTDDDVLGRPGFVAAAESVLAVCGSDAALHLRGHATSAAVLYALAEVLASAALRTGAWLLINDRVDIAMAVRANGVQLGLASVPLADARVLLGAGARIGYSAHSAEEALWAESHGADFVLVGTIYASASHPGLKPAGPTLLVQAVEDTRVPVIAIGGVTPGRVAEVAGTGAHGIAALGGVWHAADPTTAAVAYLTAVKQSWPTAGREGEP
jgi:thiamine-phosphate diphosphorylase